MGHIRRSKRRAPGISDPPQIAFHARPHDDVSAWQMTMGWLCLGFASLSPNGRAKAKHSSAALRSVGCFVKTDSEHGLCRGQLELVVRALRVDPGPISRTAPGPVHCKSPHEGNDEWRQVGWSELQDRTQEHSKRSFWLELWIRKSRASR